MRQSLIIMTLCVISPLLLSSCWWDKDEAVTTPPPAIEEVTLVDTLARYSTGEAEDIAQSLNSPNFSENELLIQKLIADAKLSASWQTNTGEIINLLMFQLQNILNQGTYEYSEATSRDKANALIKTIIQYNPSYANHPEILMFRWYGEEINKNYTWALEYYQNALTQSQRFSGTEELQARVYNQISHLYSLMGKYEEAYAYTYLAFEQDPSNYSTNLNIGRYLAMSGSISMSVPYFEYALNTPSLPMQSEIYFTLSSLMLSNKDGLYDIPKAIEYAEKSIEKNPSYPMGYFALAQAYYMQNDASNHTKMEEALKKSIELNPNGYNSYELLWLLKFDKWDLDGAIADIKKAIDVLPRDMILMDDQRGYLKNRLIMLIALLGHVDSKETMDKEQFETFFLAEQYSVDNVVTQLTRKRNGVFGTSGDAIKLYFNK